MRLPSHAVQPLSPALLLWFFLLKCPAQPAWPGEFSSAFHPIHPSLSREGWCRGLSALSTLPCFLSSPLLPVTVSSLRAGRVSCVSVIPDTEWAQGGGAASVHSLLLFLVPAPPKASCRREEPFELREWGRPEPHQQRWGGPSHCPGLGVSH